MIDTVALLLASVGRIGFFPIAPGTVGSAAGVGLWIALMAAGAGPMAVAAAAAVLFLLGAWAATRAARLLQTEDPGPVVIDEVVGMLVSLVALPATWQVGLAGFILFRVFDVLKPWPADRLEHVPDGWGIMLDDVMAGVYAWLVLQGVWHWAPGWLA